MPRDPAAACLNTRSDPVQPWRPRAGGSIARGGSCCGRFHGGGDSPWWLVRVVAVAAEVPNGYTCPSLGGDVSFEYPRNKMALLVRRLRPATTGRGADSTRHYSLDMTVEPFLVPCHLLRVGKIKLKEQAVALPRRSSRSTATIATTASSSGARFELKAEVKAQIYERCRCW